MKWRTALSIAAGIAAMSVVPFAIGLMVREAVAGFLGHWSPHLVVAWVVLVVWALLPERKPDANSPEQTPALAG